MNEAERLLKIREIEEFINQLEEKPSNYLPEFPDSDLENISKSSDLFQFLFFLTDIYLRVADKDHLQFNESTGFKFSPYCKYYNDLQNKQLLIDSYDFLHRGDAVIGTHYRDLDSDLGSLSPPGTSIELNFDSTKIIQFTYGASTESPGDTSFYCVFFEYGATSTEKDFGIYAKWLIRNYIGPILQRNRNIPIILIGHSQGSGTVLSVLNELCSQMPDLNFKKIYGITLGLGRVSTPVANLFSNNYDAFKFNYIDIINLASTNIDATVLDRNVVERDDNYPYLGPNNDYFLEKDLTLISKPTRCIDNFINNMTVENSSCLSLERPYDNNPYFCRNKSEGINGLPFKTPWYKKIHPMFRSGVDPSDPENTKIQNWIENQKRDHIYRNDIDYILRLNKYCSTGIIENKRNWGEYNSKKFNMCEDLFTMYHKQVNVNTFGFLIDMNGKLTLKKIDKQNIVKNLLLDDIENTGKIYHIRSFNENAPTVYLYNEKNNKMICQSNTGQYGDAHEAKTYRNLFFEYSQ